MIIFLAILSLTMQWMAPTLGNLCLMISEEDNHSRQLNKIIVVKYLIVQLVIKSAELTLELVHGVVILSHIHGQNQKINTEDVVWRVIPAILLRRQGFPSLILSRITQHQALSHLLQKAFFLQTEYFNADKLYFQIMNQGVRLWRWILNVVWRHFKDVSIWSVSSYQTREQNNDNHESGEREKYSPFVPRRANKHD